MRWRKLISKSTDITLTLTTVQHAEGTERFVVTHPARLDFKNGTYYITYTDTERNIIVIKPDSVRISKPDSQSALVFEQSAEHVSNYMTPAGKMSVSVFTHKLLNCFEKERRIFIKYRLTFNGGAWTDNDLTIKGEWK